MMAAPKGRRVRVIGTNRANGLSLFVRIKLSPACLTLAKTSPRCLAASVELMVDSMLKYVKYKNTDVNQLPCELRTLFNSHLKSRPKSHDFGYRNRPRAL
jgi:hypothetical protein